LGKMFKRIKELRFENVLSKPTKELSWILCHLSWHHSWQGSAPVTHLRAHKFSNFCVNGGGGVGDIKREERIVRFFIFPLPLLSIILGFQWTRLWLIQHNFSIDVGKLTVHIVHMVPSWC
jgi:hypothetical protein